MLNMFAVLCIDLEATEHTIQCLSTKQFTL